MHPGDQVLAAVLQRSNYFGGNECESVKPDGGPVTGSMFCFDTNRLPLRLESPCENRERTMSGPDVLTPHRGTEERAGPWHCSTVGLYSDF